MPKGLDYIINLKDGNFSGAGKAKQEMQGLDEAVETSESKIGNLGGVIGKVGGMIAAAFAVGQVIAFGKESFDVYEQTAKAQGQIVAGIKSTAGAAGLSLADLTAQADTLAHKTLFSQDQTENAEAIALSFTKIKGAIFQDAIPAIEDMATRMGQDLPSVALQVGKALQDPILGVTSLQRMGVRLSDTQKETIKTMVEQGNTAGAQAMILKELSSEFGGSAEAARKTKGEMGDLDEQTHDLKVGFGKLIDDGLEVVVPALISVFKWMGNNKDMLITVAEVVGAGAAAWGVYELTMLALEAPMAIMTAAQWALDAAMDANPVGLIVVGIGALIGGLILAYKHSETFRAVLSGIGEVAHELIPIFKGLGEIILGAVTLNPAMVIGGFKDAYGGIKDIIDHGGIGGAFSRGYDESMAASKKDEAAEATKAKPAMTVHAPGGKTQPFALATGKHGRSGGGDTTTVAGGRSVRNVVVTIGKLVEKLEIHPTTIQGVGANDIKRQITELLTGAVHDSELALGSQ